MDAVMETFHMLFGADGELRQIVATTLRMAFTSTAVSCMLGIPLGVWLGMTRFPGKRICLRVLLTLMGLPPVTAGLFVFFILSRSGPLGRYKLLYSVTAMICAQILLITPVAAGLSVSIVQSRFPQMEETMCGMGIPKSKQLLYVLYECRAPLFSVLFTAFGRAISEVGAAQLVGGNVQHKTRVMTTAIVLETNMGHFQLAAALGVLLLLIAFVITSAAQFLQEKSYDHYY